MAAPTGEHPPATSTRIDAHTHLFAPSQIAERNWILARDRTFREMYEKVEAKMATVEELDRALERGGFFGAAIAGFAFTHEDDIAAQNRYLLDAPQHSRHRLAPFATVNPLLTGWHAVVEEAAAHGARGLGELRPWSQGWDPLGPQGRQLCRLARRFGLTLLWHVSEPLGHEYPGKWGGIDPTALLRLAADYPDLPMIGGHLGAGASFYLQMPEVRESIPNLYFDTAAAFLLYDEDCVARLAETVGPERVLFASDFPLLSPGRQAARIEATLHASVASGILGGNAASLLFGIRQQ